MTSRNIVVSGSQMWPVIFVYDSADIGERPAGNSDTYGLARLPTEPLGTMTLTFTNVVTGSRYRIERQGNGSLATPTGNAEGTAAGTTVVITLDYYSGGSANNDLRIKVRKGSGEPYYKDYETLATVGAGSQSVYIAQIQD